jgi:hypothetical protein
MAIVTFRCRAAARDTAGTTGEPATTVNLPPARAAVRGRGHYGPVTIRGFR